MSDHEAPDVEAAIAARRLVFGNFGTFEFRWKDATLCIEAQDDSADGFNNIFTALTQAEAEAFRDWLDAMLGEAGA